jgi:hypothetical protein
MDAVHADAEVLLYLYVDADMDVYMHVDGRSI